MCFFFTQIHSRFEAGAYNLVRSASVETLREQAKKENN